MQKKGLMGAQVARLAIRYVLPPGNSDYALLTEGHDLPMRTISCRRTERHFRRSAHGHLPVSFCGIFTASKQNVWILLIAYPVGPYIWIVRASNGFLIEFCLL